MKLASETLLKNGLVPKFFLKAKLIFFYKNKSAQVGYVAKPGCSRPTLTEKKKRKEEDKEVCRRKENEEE